MYIFTSCMSLLEDSADIDTHFRLYDTSFIPYMPLFSFDIYLRYVRCCYRAILYFFDCVLKACNPEFYNLDRRLDGRVQSDGPGAKQTYKIPAEADFHITWSLIPGNGHKIRSIRSQSSNLQVLIIKVPSTKTGHRMEC